MNITIYIISAILVFVFSGLLVIAGLGAVFLFVPLFYYLGVPLSEATPTALVLNVVNLLFSTINYWRGKLINWRVGVPLLIAARNREQSLSRPMVISAGVGRLAGFLGGLLGVGDDNFIHYLPYQR